MTPMLKGLKLFVACLAVFFFLFLHLFTFSLWECLLFSCSFALVLLIQWDFGLFRLSLYFHLLIKWYMGPMSILTVSLSLWNNSSHETLTFEFVPKAKMSVVNFRIICSFQMDKATILVERSYIIDKFYSPWYSSSIYPICISQESF